MRLKLTANDQDHFWAKVRKGKETNCWEWTAARDKHGYGRFRVGAREGNVLLAHRVSFALANSDVLPEGADICHACDNPPCVNPAHLWAGTRADNNKDMKAKGRVANGERHYRAKFTASDVQAIRSAARQESQASIARRFDVNQSTISRIVNRKRWVHGV